MVISIHMTDLVTTKKRGQMMAGIEGANTKPELTVRRYLHSHGFRYRLHDKKLPGRPDLVLPKYRAIVMVHGCYWHRHPGCKLAYTPKSRRDFWQKKFSRNIKRDAEVYLALKNAGWRVVTIWECALRNNDLRDEGLKYLANWIRSDQRKGEYPPTT